MLLKSDKEAVNGDRQRSKADGKELKDEEKS